MCLFLILSLLFPVAADEPPALKQFNERVKAYAELHKKIDSKIDPVDATSSPELLVKQKQQFITALQKARANARQGHIFNRGVRPIFLKILKRELKGPTNTEPRAMVLGEGNPKAKDSPKAPPLKVNGTYPTESPVSTMPPSVLLALPQLPEALEYRFIGRHLILRDTKADIIVDFIMNAAP